MVRKLQIMNMISAISFFLSSFCLLFIPLLDITEGLPIHAYLIAVLFWAGLIIGVALQIYLKIKCRKMELRLKDKRYRIFYLIAMTAFIIFVVLALLHSRSSIAVVGSLFCTIVSLQSAAIIKRRGCLK